ncbi:MAG: hypothetical protein RL154_1278 [Pseudomonadota bacterium]|jgi:hypothetical protein
MFDEKDRIKYLSEGIRNIGVALVAGSMVAYITEHGIASSIVLLLYGLLNFSFGYSLLKD